MNRSQHILSKFPDCDDALRRLADVLKAPATCRKRACRRDGSCQGGFGPPCYFEHRQFFADALRERMQEYRDYWTEQREGLRAILRR
ncbi:hypothetical protein [Microvirga alba]|uniref:Uncharacterized protein n=1 Tax=Microvirga alba TaxID=2791025 RepID=A0A931BQ86_9HYPH|nr:hypothetical protein [Microvirga alba]MBF9232578.1 hypothetical protein [Microvirga alba]